MDARDDSGRTALLIALQGSASEYRVIGANEFTVSGSAQRRNKCPGQLGLVAFSEIAGPMGRSALVKFLIDPGANVNAPLKERERAVKDGRTPLMVGVRLGANIGLFPCWTRARL